MPFRRSLFFAPGRLFLVSVLFTIVIGTFLLALPYSRTTSIPLIDIFFTATSATCVTGLLTTPLSSFTPFGQAVILLLIQIGALGLVTLTISFVSLFFEVGFSTQLMTGQLFEVGTWKSSRHILTVVMVTTFVAELVGTLCIFSTLPKNIDRPFFTALFQAVSAFTNGGFSLLEHNGILTHAPGVLIPTALLVLTGGLGFIVIDEIMRWCGTFFIQKKRFHFSLHSKIVLFTTACIILMSSLIIWLLEYQQYPFEWRFIGYAFFNTICCRSAGFTTFSLPHIHFATLFFIMIISFIGSSPGSTGSGIKTTTFALFIASIKAVFMRTTTVDIKNRAIPNDQIFKAMAILSLSLSWVAVSIFFLLITDPGWRFIDTAFTAFAAFSNLGLETGMITTLSPSGKTIMMMSMIIGRIGVLTILSALRKQHESLEIHYPEERVIMN